MTQMSFNPLRKLAQDFKWQFLYMRSQEMSSVRLFDNSMDLTRVQIDFLQWLQVYSVAEDDLLNEKPYISRKVIQDDMRLDAYYMLKKQLQKQEKQQDKKGKKKKDNKTPHPSIPSVVFKKG